MRQHLLLPKRKAAGQGLFRTLVVSEFRPNGLKCGVRAYISAKPIKNHVRSCDRIECVFQKAELRTGFAGVRGFGTDVFEQKRNCPVWMWFSRNAIGDSVSWLPNVAVAAVFSGGFELGQLVAPITIIFGFGQKPLAAECIKESGQIGL